MAMEDDVWDHGEVAVTVVLRDETAAGKALSEQTVVVPERLTLRELIRHRVREEVARYNAGRGETFLGLVQPTDTEATLNGYRLRAPRTLDWERQADVALAGFGHNAFVVLVGERQVDDLDAELAMHEADDVAFVRLVPLRGG